jgi:hypothetical protein
MKIAALALLVSLSAHAEPPKEMYMPNDAGGFVVLTAEPCAHKNVAKEYTYRAYATESSEAVYHEGCWSSPDTSEVPTELMVKEEGAGPAPTLRVIQMVNTWWVEGGKATFFQSAFLPEKKRYLSNGTIDTTLKPIIVKP